MDAPELHLLELVERGEAAFPFDQYSNLDAIDAQLQALRERGYVRQVIRVTRQDDFGKCELVKLFLIDVLTELGRERRRSLQSQLALDLIPPNRSQAAHT